MWKMMPKTKKFELKKILLFYVLRFSRFPAPRSEATALYGAIQNLLLLFFFTPGSKGSRGLKTKVKNKAGMAIGPVDPWKTSRAKAPS